MNTNKMIECINNAIEHFAADMSYHSVGALAGIKRACEISSGIPLDPLKQIWEKAQYKHDLMASLIKNTGLSREATQEQTKNIGADVDRLQLQVVASQVLCGCCAGTGRYLGSPPGQNPTCHNCNGEGLVPEGHENPEIKRTWQDNTCSDCDEELAPISEHDNCDAALCKCNCPKPTLTTAVYSTPEEPLTGTDLLDKVIEDAESQESPQPNGI